MEYMFFLDTFMYDGMVQEYNLWPVQTLKRLHYHVKKLLDEGRFEEAIRIYNLCKDDKTDINVMKTLIIVGNQYLSHINYAMCSLHEFYVALLELHAIFSRKYEFLKKTT